MENKNKLALVLAIIPILMIAMSGMTLSHWDDDVKVEGSISMGTFNVEMSLEDTCDNEGNLDVGSISAQLLTWDDGDDMDGGFHDLLLINMSNVYPGYYGCVYFNIENNGTIPAYLSTSNVIITSNSSFNWTQYGQYINMTLYYKHGNTTTPIAHLDNGVLVWTYDFQNDPLGILTLDVGEMEYFILCIGLSGDPNAPEQMMDTTMGFSVTMTWLQAVP